MVSTLPVRGSTCFNNIDPEVDTESLINFQLSPTPALVSTISIQKWILKVEFVEATFFITPVSTISIQKWILKDDEGGNGTTPRTSFNNIDPEVDTERLLLVNNVVLTFTVSTISIQKWILKVKSNKAERPTSEVSTISIQKWILKVARGGEELSKDEGFNNIDPEVDTESCRRPRPT